MNPTTAAKNRTARLAREAAKPLYTSETGKPTGADRDRARRDAAFNLAPAWGSDQCPCGDC